MPHWMYVCSVPEAPFWSSLFLLFCPVIDEVWGSDVGIKRIHTAVRMDYVLNINTCMHVGMYVSM